jgi:hypothetical protein
LLLDVRKKYAPQDDANHNVLAKRLAVAVEMVQGLAPKPRGTRRKRPRGPDRKTIEGVERMKVARREQPGISWKKLYKVGGFDSENAAKTAMSIPTIYNPWVSMGSLS